jgi:hypothetical protein
VDRAIVTLESLIHRRGDADEYPYHVLGSQSLSWVRRGITSRDEKADFLRRIIKIVADGVQKHPRSKELAKLKKDLENELFSIAVY